MSWSRFTRLVVLGSIDAACGDPSEMKRRILLARQCGFLNDDEAEDWLRAAKLVHA